MRLGEAEIKAAVLHPELRARTAAVCYFSRSFSGDDAIMLLVIEAVEKYGRDQSEDLLFECDELRQTNGTIDWCIRELQRDSDRDDEFSDYQYDIARILAHADLSTMLDRESEIAQLLTRDSVLERVFRERVSLHGKTAQVLWQELEDLCEREKSTEQTDEIDLPRAYCLVEALARHRETMEPRVLSILEEDVADSEDGARELLQVFLIRLAGEMRLTSAVPPIIDALKQGDELREEQCGRALVQIGGDDVARSLSLEFPTAPSWEFQLAAANVLGNIHSDSVFDWVLELFNREEEISTKARLAEALLAQFKTEAVEPVRQFILSMELDPEVAAAREALLGTSRVLGVDFPEREEWEEESEKISDYDIDESFRQIWEGLARHAETMESLAADERAQVADFDDSPTPAQQIIRATPRIGRNDPCPCGSGKKYKKCCLNKTSDIPEAD
jgi:hypothetical protein